MNYFTYEAKFLNFVFVAYILYLSSKMIGIKRNDTKSLDNDFLSYMRNQYLEGNFTSEG